MTRYRLENSYKRGKFYLRRTRTNKIALVAALAILCLVSQGSLNSYYVNISENLPRGVYKKTPSSYFLSVSTVSPSVPQSVKDLTSRDWLPNNIPSIKPIIEIASDNDCIKSQEHRINQQYLSIIVTLDSNISELRQIQFCRDLRVAALFHLDPKLT